MKELPMICSKRESAPNKFLAERLIDTLYAKKMTVAVCDPYGCLSDALVIQNSTKVFKNGLIDPGISSDLSPEIALWQARRVRNEMKDSFGVSVITDLKTLKLNEPTKVYFGFDQKGKDPWFDYFVIKPGLSRREAKLQIVERALTDSLLYLSNRHLDSNVQNKYFNNLQSELVVNGDVERLLGLLNYVGLKIATIESCTGGAIANLITDSYLSEGFFIGGAQTNNESAKIYRGVDPERFKYGMVYSQDVARAMAVAMMRMSGADVVIATTGVMENQDIRDEYHKSTKPGTVHFAVLFKDKAILPLVETRFFDIKSREEMKMDISSYIFNRIFNHICEQLNITVNQLTVI